MLYDSVQLFAVALTELSRARDVRTASLSCAKPRPWTHGSSLSNYVRTVLFVISITPLFHIAVCNSIGDFLCDILCNFSSFSSLFIILALVLKNTSVRLCFLSRLLSVSISFVSILLGWNYSAYFFCTSYLVNKDFYVRTL